MKLAALSHDLTHAHILGNRDVEVLQVTADSRAVKAGTLFVAVPGATAQSRHGREFISQAVQQGAAGVVVDAQVPGLQVPQLVVKDARAAFSVLAEALHGNPTRAMRLLGVTGTNGKTTSAHLMEAMAMAAGQPAGFIGTTAIRVAGEERKTAHTTPPADVLSSTFADMVKAGVKTCAMEVSSHALEQRRVEGLHFRGAAFTNLTQDHLDYHATMDAYLAAKQRLFSELLPVDAVGVLNADDARVLSTKEKARCKVLTFSATGGKADVRAVDVKRLPDGTAFDVEGALGSFHIRTPLVGVYNIANILGAAVLHLATGTPLAAVQLGVANLKRVPGRLDAVEHVRGAHVLVDYAHTDDALARALDAVKPYVAPGGKLYCVFGCGGDRDALKRPKMGRAAAERADVVIITSDNPRSEEPSAIAASIVDGVTAAGMQRVDGVGAARGFLVELDRRKAIGLVVKAAKAGDVVLIAGKGHETEQIIGAQKLPFDDRQVAREEMGAA